MGVICADLGALTTARAYSEQKQTFYVIAYVSSTFSFITSLCGWSTAILCAMA